MNANENKNIRYFFKTVNCLMAGYIVLRVLQRLISSWNNWNWYASSWGVTEYMVNYQGGYVRRGLIGEILYQLSLLTSIDPRWYILLISGISLAFVVWFLLNQHRKHGLCWWILPLNVCLMGAYDLIRKDFLCALLVIVTLYAYSRLCQPWLRLITVTLVLALALNAHECIFFMIGPMLMLLFLRKSGMPLMCRIFGGLMPPLLMVVICMHKGDAVVAQKIWSSWAEVSELFSHGEPMGTIASIGWDTQYAINYHISENFLTPSCLIVYGWYSKPIIWLVIVFVVINVLFLYKRKESLREDSGVHRLLSIMIFQFVSLIPMFTVLSCDGARVCFYWLVSTMCIYFCLSEQHMWHAFPAFYLNMTKKVQAMMITGNSWKIASVFVLFLAVSQNYTNVLGAFESSVVGTYVYAVKMFVEKLLPLLV